MTIIQRGTEKLACTHNSTYVGSRTVDGRAAIKGTLPLRFKRRRHREPECRPIVLWVIKPLVIISVVTWFFWIFFFFFGDLGLATIPTGTGQVLQISPNSLKRMPIRVSNSAKSNTAAHHHKTNGAYESPLLIFTCKRPSYLNKTLEKVLAAIPQPCGFGCPVIVSEDGQHKEIEDIVMSFMNKYEEKGIQMIHINHQRNMRSNGNAYEALAKHYGWALSQVFDGSVIYKNVEDVKQESLPKRVIILEEDIEVAPDFFTYMESTASLLDHDSTLYAVSAFNDNGHIENGDPKRLLRSDFFPGLGWMMNRDLWENELESKWPSAYWDDWLREVEQRKDRQVIRPEVSRTHHFGAKGGASSNQFGNVLARNKLNKKEVKWDIEDLSYLENSSYANQYTKLVTSSKLVHSIKEAKHASLSSNVRMEYEDFSFFSKLASQLGIMEDEKVMVPRTAYRGIVEVRLGSSLLFLTPKGGFGGYKLKTK